MQMQLFQEAKPTGKKLLTLCECYIQNYLDKLVIDPRKEHQIRKHRTRGTPILERKKINKLRNQKDFHKLLFLKLNQKDLNN